VHLVDSRHDTRDSFGSFDGVACVGGFEHFCSPDDYFGLGEFADLTIIEERGCIRRV
jgi:hypothetical protein